MRGPAILLPGIVAPAGITWARVTPLLAPDRPVLPLDLAVYAGGAVREPHDLGTEARAVLEAADTAGFDRFHAAGFSAGGAVASVLAQSAPERLLSLALIEPAWFGNSGIGAREQAARDRIAGALDLPEAERLDAFAAALLAEGIAPPPPPPRPAPAWMVLRPAGARAITHAFGVQDLDPAALAGLPVPVLFVRGGRSAPDVWETMEDRVRATFADVETALFPDRHHFDPPQRAEPQRLAEMLEGFWQRAEG